MSLNLSKNVPLQVQVDEVKQVHTRKTKVILLSTYILIAISKFLFCSNGIKFKGCLTTRCQTGSQTELLVPYWSRHGAGETFWTVQNSISTHVLNYWLMQLFQFSWNFRHFLKIFVNVCPHKNTFHPLSKPTWLHHCAEHIHRYASTNINITNVSSLTLHASDQCSFF